jgi:alpha-ketoglutarate-dependent taurine dioxygenase
MVLEKLDDAYGLILKTVQPDEFLRLGRENIQKHVIEHGVLLFRSQKLIDRNTFIKLSEGFSDQFIIHGAKVRRPVTEDGTVQTVTEGPDAICLHTEMHFSPFAPRYMWFFCENAPAKGGETTICDGELFYRHLSPNTQKLLQSKMVKYWNLWDADVWQKYFGGASKDQVVEVFAKNNAKAWFNDENELEFEIVKSALTKTARGNLAFANSIAVHDLYQRNLKLFEAKGQASKVRHRIGFEDGSEIPPQLIKELLAVEAELVLPLQWKDGDVILLDNHRVLHGRKAFDPAIKRTILVRMAKAA